MSDKTMRPECCEELYKNPSGAWRNEELPEGFRIQNRIFSADAPGKVLCTLTARTYAEAEYYADLIISGDRAALQSVASQGARKEKSYYAWLIEQRDDNGKPTWLCNPYYPEFIDNAWEALHFGRKRDAEAYADSEIHVLYITEHAFPAVALLAAMKEMK